MARRDPQRTEPGALITRRALLLSGAIVLVAIAIRVAFVLGTPHYALRSDPADYHRIAVSIATHHTYGQSVVAPGGGPSAYRPPLYPISLGAYYWVAGVSVRSARLAQAVLGGLAVALFGLVALQLFRRRVVAAVAMALAAVYPTFVTTGTALLTESLALPLELGALATALAARASPSPRLARRWALATGALAGLGILNRPNTALLLIPLVVLLAVPWRTALAAVGIALATLVPWLVRDARAFDKPVLLTTQTGIVMAGTYNSVADHDGKYPGAFRPFNLVPQYNAIRTQHPTMGEYEEERRLRSASLHYIRDHPLYPAKVAFWNTVRLFDLTGRFFGRQAAASIGYSNHVADVGLYASWVAMAIAVLGAFTGAARRVPKVVWLVPVAVVASTVFFQGETRMRTGVEPFILLLAAAALTGATRRGTSSS